MYSQQLENYIQQAGQISGLDPKQINLLNQSMSSYLATFTKIIDGELADFPYDPLATSLQLLSLSIALSETNIDANTESIHYLVAMGLEQSGELLARLQIRNYINYPPLSNDLWYRLSLAFLHYMAGGFRVQSVSVLHHLQRIRDEINEGDWKQEYIDATKSFESLFRGRYISKPINRWENLLFGSTEPDDIQERRIFHLSRHIQNRRRIALTDLGLGAESEWLKRRGITDISAIGFWKKYLENLEIRGYTNFTEEQIGSGFENWLIPNNDLVAILPTGSGKTLIGELKTSLTLAQGGQTIWISPMRVLIRQVKKDFKRAFRDTGVNVEELPVTEDLIPLYTDAFPQTKTAAVTTPEKLAALLRNRSDVIKNVKLVVLDEAQIIFDPNRGATIEYVLQELNRIVPECSFVLLSAFADKREKLTTFVSRLRQHPPMELTSENRPTRRIYGVITNRTNNGFALPTIQVYPAGAEIHQGKLKSAISINLKQTLSQSKIKDIEIAQSIIKSLVSTSVRAVMFVNSRISANSQAKQLANSIVKKASLPELDIARLKVELGRTSIIETTSEKGVAPHHAGLAKLEQYFVEKWTQDQVINIVVATPTLAQGVNLPFDLAVLTFLKRQNKRRKSNDPIPTTEILNMIGRAGRAGQVSDGLCLISMKTSSAKRPIDTLNSARQYFFQQILPSQEFIGLSRLLQVANKANISQPDWVYELSDLEFSETQSLISFALSAIQAQDVKAGLLSRLSLFPSMQDFQEEQSEVVTQLEALIQNALDQCQNDNELLQAVTRTGMPIEMLRYFFATLRQNNLQSDNLFDQVDNIVQDALELCQSRSWLQSLLDRKKLSDVILAIKKWRHGESYKQIEDTLNWGRSENEKQINICRFFNHDISLYAQFWGAFAICAEYVLENQQTRNQIARFQTFVREGVSNMVELEWLNKIGGLDRVLAHRIAENMDTSFIDEQNPGGFIQRQIELWKNRNDLIPLEITNLDLLKALNGVLNEL
jgi:replicative superfamily II helicase